MKKSTELVPVAARDLQIIEYRGQRVVTTEQLAAGYGATPIRIRQNHSRNEERFVVGKHYFLLEGDELRELKHRVSQSYSVKIASNVRSLILWTERGAANHAKLLETDQAWNYHEDLVEFYFTQRENIDVQRVLTRKELALMVIEAEERAEAMALENKTLSATVDSLEKHFSRQVMEQHQSVFARIIPETKNDSLLESIIFCWKAMNYVNLSTEYLKATL